jgi:hypothetical protein
MHMQKFDDENIILSFFFTFSLIRKMIDKNMGTIILVNNDWEYGEYYT